MNAIAEFEKVLITPDSPFDKYLKGSKKAISQKAKEGYALFKSKGCILCHHGVNIGGNFYNKFGIYEDARQQSIWDDITLQNVKKTNMYLKFLL